jgi:hypothetical protein
VKRPICTFAALFERGSEQDILAQQTLELVEPLREAQFPFVIEHGDLVEPNLIRLRDGRMGVVDWELAQPRGLPLSDLYVFLAYVSFATERARRIPRRLRAFDRAFFSPGAWATPIVAGEADRLGIDHALLAPFFLACWARYVAAVVSRDEPWRRPVTTGSPPPLEERGHWTTAYVERNTHYALWRHAVEHADELRGISRRRFSGRFRSRSP